MAVETYHYGKFKFDTHNNMMGNINFGQHWPGLFESGLRTIFLCMPPKTSTKRTRRNHLLNIISIHFGWLCAHYLLFSFVQPFDLNGFTEMLCRTRTRSQPKGKRITWKNGDRLWRFWVTTKDNFITKKHPKQKIKFENQIWKRKNIKNEK